MRKTPADADAAHNADIERLRQALDAETKRANSLHKELVEAKARLDTAEQIVQATRLAALGVVVGDCAIEQLDPARDEGEAKEMLAALVTQAGCYGGRVLPPKTGRPDWTAQTFWEVPAVPPTAVLFGLYDGGLPEGARYVIMAGSYLRGLVAACRQDHADGNRS